MPDRDDTQTGTTPVQADLSRVLGMASEIFSAGQAPAVPSPAPQPAASSADLPSNLELAVMLRQMLPEGAASAAEPSPAPPTEPEPSGPTSIAGLGSLAAALPPILQALSGNGDFVRPEKLNLLRALRPYLSAERGSNIDRAIKMANVARAAKTALAALGR